MSGFHLLPCPLTHQLINGGKGGEARLAGKTKDALVMCASRGQGEAEMWLCGVQAAGAGGKRKRNTKRTEWRDGGEEQ